MAPRGRRQYLDRHASGGAVGAGDTIDHSECCVVLLRTPMKCRAVRGLSVRNELKNPDPPEKAICWFCRQSSSSDFS